MNAVEPKIPCAAMFTQCSVWLYFSQNEIFDFFFPAVLITSWLAKNGLAKQKLSSSFQNVCPVYIRLVYMGACQGLSGNKSSTLFNLNLNSFLLLAISNSKHLNHKR